jgi:hypothetical protein
MNAEEGCAGLCFLGEALGRKIEHSRGEGLVDRNVDAANPGAVHADMGHEISAGVDDGDVARRFDLCRLRLTGADHAPRIFE